MSRRTREEQDKYNNHLDAVMRNAKELDPSDRVWFARFMLDSVDDVDFDYGNFEAAKSVRRHVKAARRELKGLPL